MMARILSPRRTNPGAGRRRDKLLRDRVSQYARLMPWVVLIAVHPGQSMTWSTRCSAAAQLKTL